MKTRKLSLDERLLRLTEQTEINRDQLALLARQVFADRDRLARLEAAAQDGNPPDQRPPLTARPDLADPDLDRELLTLLTQQAKADRDRLARLEEAQASGARHRNNLSQALENAFAASLPRAMLRRDIVIRPQDILMRVQEDGNSREFDFIARNGDLALAGEVKNHLTRENVTDFLYALAHDLRAVLAARCPAAAALPVYGVVAGALIDDDALRIAREEGLFVLRPELGDLHPDTAGANFHPRAFPAPPAPGAAER